MFIEIFAVLCLLNAIGTLLTYCATYSVSRDICWYTAIFVPYFAIVEKTSEYINWFGIVLLCILATPFLLLWFTASIIMMLLVAVWKLFEKKE